MIPTLYQPIPISQQEVERIRLLLSTYQDGTGQLSGGMEPVWRDFERVTALAFAGVAQESKSFFDVLVPRPDGIPYGISCKMRRTLNWTLRTGRVVVEVSNASARFSAALVQQGYGQTLLAHPQKVADLVVQVVEEEIAATSLAQGASWISEAASTSSLSYTPRTRAQPHPLYQLHQFAPTLPDPASLRWSWPVTHRGQRRLVGADAAGAVVLEWYNTSGGQLKYYPQGSEATWHSPIFQLEPLPEGEYGIISKAAAYFPELWHRCQP